MELFHTKICKLVFVYQQSWPKVSLPLQSALKGPVNLKIILQGMICTFESDFLSWKRKNNFENIWDKQTFSCAVEKNTPLTTIIFNFRGRLLSSLFSKNTTKCLKTAISLKISTSSRFESFRGKNCSFEALRGVFGKKWRKQTRVGPNNLNYLLFKKLSPNTD